MKKKRILSLLLAAATTVTLLASCGTGSNTASSTKSSGEHEAITMLSAFPGTDKLLALVKEKYPEINLEIIPYSGANMTAYMKAERDSGEIPDIYVSTTYTPGQDDMSNLLIDLSSYPFTNNYAESQLRSTSDDGKLYMLPTYYNCIGITYNKTLLEKNGWALPTTFAELEALAPQVEAAGYNLAIDQITLPGYGFQYFCNIMDTSYLNTLEGRKWQNDFLNGTATMQGNQDLVDALSTLDKWRDLGMLNDNTDFTSDSKVKAMMIEGNTVFMLGGTNNITKEDSDDDFGFMPYLSEDGTQNALIMNVVRYVGLSKKLEDAGNEQKLEDAVHVMELISTVEGMSAISYGFEDTMLLPLQDYVIPETNFYKQVEDALNAGLTAPFIYAGWDNLVVPVGNVMQEYIKGNAELADVIAAFDDNQKLLSDTASVSFTTVTETLDTDDCAKLVGICFGQASGADLALISTNKWYPLEGGYVSLNLYGVSGSLFPLPVTEQEITAILPTGWNGNIQTVTLTGARIKELVETGYQKDEQTYPYDLIAPDGLTLEDDKTYTVAICGVTDEVSSEGNLTDTGILGLDAMKEYLSQFKTLSKDDLQWE